MLVIGGLWDITGQVPMDSMIYNLIPPLTPDYAIIVRGIRVSFSFFVIQATIFFQL